MPNAKTCRLDALAGATTLCTEGDCPFWEPGGAVLEGRCAFEKIDLTRRPAVVTELLRLREVLAACRLTTVRCRPGSESTASSTSRVCSCSTVSSSGLRAETSLTSASRVEPSSSTG